jgi:hypothetical protein
MQGPCWCGAGARAGIYATARTDYFLVGKGCVLLFGIKYNPSNDSGRNALCRNGTTRVLYANLERASRCYAACTGRDMCTHHKKSSKLNFAPV